MAALLLFWQNSFISTRMVFFPDATTQTHCGFASVRDVDDGTDVNAHGAQCAHRTSTKASVLIADDDYITILGMH